MAQYQHLLLAVDLQPDCVDFITERAIVVAKEHNAKVTIVHAIEHINAYGVAQAYPTLLDVEQQLMDDAKAEIEKLCTKHSLKDSQVLIEVGSPKIVILDVAKRLNIDLIVLGSHGRHGLTVLLGSTANAVLHHATCDVLAVRLKN